MACLSQYVATETEPKMTDRNLTQCRLKELLHYNPATGIFTWRMSNSNRVKAGSVAGWVNFSCYCMIGVDGNHYNASRLAFLYMTGDLPELQVDHINHKREDDRWSNLREASNQENGRNKSLYSTNTTGVVGVIWHKVKKKWKAQIMADGKVIHLGYFDSLDNAAAARKTASIKYGYHENHGASLGDLA